MSVVTIGCGNMEGSYRFVLVNQTQRTRTVALKAGDVTLSEFILKPGQQNYAVQVIDPQQVHGARTVQVYIYGLGNGASIVLSKCGPHR